jgi:hypothetical protein
MTRAMGQIGLFVGGIVEKAKLRKGMLLAIAIVCVLQAYFVRELLAAELLFALGFAVLLTLGAIAYVIGAIGERGLDLAEVGVHVAADSARRGYSLVEEISRKSFRHPRSESAQ